MIGRQQLESSSKLLVRNKQVGLKVGRVERVEEEEGGGREELGRSQKKKGRDPKFWFLPSPPPICWEVASFYRKM
ncbi:hypothetical protein LINPERPRIM_LOCUS7373, partial [Linum perenne]